MKNGLIYIHIALLISLTHLHSQTLTGERNPNLSRKKNFYEGGMNIYTLDLRSNDYLYRFPSADNYLYRFDDQVKTIENNFFQGINFKYYFGKNVLRSAFNYYKKTETNNYGNYSSDGIARTGVLNIGYERLFRKARFSPYVFVDLNYTYREQKGNEYLYNQWIWPNSYVDRSYLLKTSAVGISPGVGLRYNPFKSIVFNIETNIQCYFSIMRDAKNGAKPYRTKDIKTNPLQCSIGFIF